jgi:signal transduction histidine kinase
MSRGRVQLGEVVDEALGIAKYYHRTKHRDIETAISRELPPVVGVRDHLTQVVLNLILNAIDATDADGRIRLSGAWDRAGWVVLTVADDGRGVAPQERDRLFQPYFTTKPRGTGLGLYVSRQIVEEHGGRIELGEPEAEEGAVFQIRLPAAGFEALPAPRRDGSSALEGVGR